MAALRRLLQRSAWQEWALLLFVAVIIAANSVWIFQDHAPLLWDIAGHSYRSSLYANYMQHGQVLQVLQYSTIYPPFSYLITAIAFLLFGWHADIPQYSQALFVIVFAASLYSIGIQLLKSRTSALIAVVITLLSPQFAHFTRIYDLDFQQATMVTLCIALLLATQQFTHKRYTILFSVAVACAFLTKWTSVLFLAGPTVFVLVEAWQYRKHDNKAFLRARKNIIGGLILIFLLCIPWYALHAKDIARISIATRHNGFSVPFENILSLGSILFYKKSVWLGMTPTVFIISAVGFFTMLWQKKYCSWGILVAWVGVPLILMTFVLYSKETRYFLSAYPAFALAVGALFHNGKADAHDTKKFRQLPKAVQRFFTVLVIIALFIVSIAWIETTWNQPILHSGLKTMLGHNEVYGYKAVQEQTPAWGRTFPQTWMTEGVQQQVATRIREDIEATRVAQSPETSTDTIDIAVVPNSATLTAQQIQYAGIGSGLQNASAPWTVDYSLSSIIRGKEWRKDILLAEYLVTKTGDQGPTVWGPALKEIRDEEKKSDSEIFAQFTLLETYTVQGFENKPQTVRVYRKNK